MQPKPPFQPRRDASKLLELRAVCAQQRTEVVRFKQMVETSPDPMLVADEEGRILYWNAAAERLFGHAATEIDVPRIGELVDEAALGSREMFEAWIGHALGKVQEIGIVDRSRTIHRMEASVSRWLEDGESVYGTVLSYAGMWVTTVV